MQLVLFCTCHTFLSIIVANVLKNRDELWVWVDHVFNPNPRQSQFKNGVLVHQLTSIENQLPTMYFQAPELWPDSLKGQALGVSYVAGPYL